MSPVQLRIVYVDIDDQSRFERLGIRAEVHTVLLSADAHSSEQQVTTTLQNIAEMTLDGRKPIEDCVATVLEWMAKQ
jgi:hypothetical protein